MRLLLVSAAVLGLAACNGPIEPVGGAGAPPVAAGDSVSVRIARAGPAARGFAEELAARCLLDGVLGGAAMVVDRSTGRIVIMGDREEIVAIEVVPSGGDARLRLSGPAAADPQLRQAMLHHIERAARTGQTACPPLPA